MKFNFKKELPLLLLSLLPAVYLAIVWQNLPSQVPLQWGLDGTINRYGSKMELLFLGILPFVLYLLFLFIPKIDPKKRVNSMGNKYYSIRLITALFITVLFVYIIYAVNEQSLGHPTFILMLIGAFFVLLGNYFKTIRPNYFVGIRTPWTLENDTIWKNTHKFAGKFWVAGGLLIIFACAVFNEPIAVTLFIIITAIITIVPIAYSYIQFKKMASLIVLIILCTSSFAQQKLNRPQTPEAPFLYTIEEVAFTNTQDNVKLAGTLTYPAEGTNFPAVILITGSGPQDRNEEIFNHKPFWVLADYLTNRGIAVLRYDDRGVGESTGDFSRSTSVDFARDVVAAIEFLKNRKEINTQKIGLIGHSEGGVIAPLVASAGNNIAFVVTLAGVMIPGRELMLRQKEMQLRAMGSNENFISKELEFDSGIMNTITTSETDSLKTNLEKYTTEYFETNPTFASEHGMTEAYYKNLIVGSYSSPWLSNFIKYDPKNSLENLNVPLLALNGEKDLQVPATENLEALRAIMAKDTTKNFTLKTYPNLNHLFQECQTGMLQEYGQIEQTISPKVLHDIAAWILSQN
ncbi:alpha/beta fold hydrolase [Aequorivita marisscotiae]|uniref:Alpha/beta fold hydrolase n=1 Tax=Aequorivita marisscotiae TaxID=3040348 RepID=A0ABY8KVR7_9FLAO|nr:alpha/beta fold hydrolase [Aequorivita sp. Ant34-E75]WGF92619.1 alpha/beta fold hydrolase [Aequorivita sp. Ant34-E75]